MWVEKLKYTFFVIVVVFRPFLYVLSDYSLLYAQGSLLVALCSHLELQRLNLGQWCAWQVLSPLDYPQYWNALLMSTPITAQSPSGREPSAPSFSQRWKDLVCTFSTPAWALPGELGSQYERSESLKDLHLWVPQDYDNETVLNWNTGTFSEDSPGLRAERTGNNAVSWCSSKRGGCWFAGQQGQYQWCIWVMQCHGLSPGLPHATHMLYYLCYRVQPSPAYWAAAPGNLVSNCLSLGVGCDQTEPGRVRNTLCFCLPPTLKPN